MGLTPMLWVQALIPTSSVKISRHLLKTREFYQSIRNYLSGLSCLIKSQCYDIAEKLLKVTSITKQLSLSGFHRYINPHEMKMMQRGHIFNIFYKLVQKIEGGRFMVFTATFNTTSVISWWPVLLVEETEVHREHERPVTSH